MKRVGEAHQAYASFCEDRGADNSGVFSVGAWDCSVKTFAAAAALEDDYLLHCPTP